MVMSNSAIAPLSFSSTSFPTSFDASSFQQAPGAQGGDDTAYWTSWQNKIDNSSSKWDAAGSASNSALDDALQQLLAALMEIMSESSSSDGASGGTGYGGGSGGSGGGFAPTRHAGASSGSGSGGGTGQQGDLNVKRAGSGNPAGIAEGLLNTSAASIMQNQQVPMDKGIPTDVCCANFASACLVKAGELPDSQHTNSVGTLAGELKGDGWHNESRSQAKPGDVCIVGGDEHVEIVASNDNGRITLVGSNNTDGGSGPQVVSYDNWTGNQGDVQFLSQ
jgi:hypothetical protein